MLKATQATCRLPAVGAVGQVATGKSRGPRDSKHDYDDCSAITAVRQLPSRLESLPWPLNNRPGVRTVAVGVEETNMKTKRSLSRLHHGYGILAANIATEQNVGVNRGNREERFDALTNRSLTEESRLTSVRD
jgi:hypothetical protein